MKQSDYSVLDKDLKIVFVTSEFNRNHTEALEEKNENFLKENGFKNIEKFLVP
jgi:6,7-dimethyl-8-ribityllumazine synthase